MRILHIVTATHRRGAEVAAAHLAEALERAGTTNRIVAIVPGEPALGHVRVDRVLNTAPRSRLRWLPRALGALRDELQDRPQIILAHGALATTVAVLATGRHGPPVVWQRILESPTRPWWHPSQLLRRALARRIHAAVAISTETEHELRLSGFTGPVWRIPNHRPPEAFAGARRDSVRRDLGLPSEEPLVSFVAHLVTQKAPERAIEVFAEIDRRMPGVHYVVAGDGPLRTTVEREAMRRLGQQRVRFLGHHDDVAGLLAASDVLISTSRADSMPGVVIEAQMAGCPVVGFPVDGLDVAVVPGETGIITSEPDPVEAAEAVCELLADPQRRARMGDAARESSRRFSTEAVVDRYLAMLCTVTGIGPAGSYTLAHVLPDIGFGGAEQAVCVLAQNMPDVRHVLVSIGGLRHCDANQIVRELADSGVGHCDLGVRRRPTRSAIGLLTAATRLQRAVRRLHVDVVDAALLDATLPMRLLPGGPIRVAHLVNTPYSEIVATTTRSAGWRRKALRLVDAVTARRDHAQVAITGAVAQANIPALHLRAQRVHVISRGVDVEAFRPAASAADGGAATILSVARLVPQKGHDTLVRAVAAARDRGDTLRLTIVGEGPERIHLEQLIDELQLVGAVTVTEPTRDVALLHAEHGVFALASRWEGQSNAVLEAMACGSAVVVSDVDALKEVVGHAGRVVPVDDVAAWSETLVALSKDPEERAMLGARARHRAVEHFDAGRSAAALSSLHRSLICSSGVRTRRHEPSGAGDTSRGRRAGDQR